MAANVDFAEHQNNSVMAGKVGSYGANERWTIPRDPVHGHRPYPVDRGILYRVKAVGGMTIAEYMQPHPEIPRHMNLFSMASSPPEEFRYREPAILRPKQANEL
ncbi:hypothetical protein N2599_09315 [Rhizobium sullae]|uniref:Uncharacterized protein n=1 Tax=Rhizobium sullae TaxID=50338 RepID=A0ABY5XPY5_RHISU|nr:hypothetical protein [Rhizobium sullae]UWU16161.1 hypothetical protein N2599_09315 [Rhizobium sullae]